MWSIFPDIFVREQRLFLLSLIFGFFKKYLHHFQRRPIPVVKFCLWRNYYYNTRIKLQRIREDYAEYRVIRILIKIINQMHYTTWTFTEYLLFIMINIHVIINSRHNSLNHENFFPHRKGSWNLYFKFIFIVFIWL